MDKRIEIGTGCCSLIFGTTKDEVEMIIGRPDKIYKTDAGFTYYQYFKYKIELLFDENDNDLLGWMEIYNSDVSIFGEYIIGENKNKVLRIMKENVNDIPKVDDYGSFESINFDKYCIELQFKFDILTNLNFGYLYNEQDEPIWPKRERDLSIPYGTKITPK